ncbi:MAG: RDD family protein [Limisphaerales bacterium]
MSWYYAVDQQQMGPVSEAELRTLRESGTITEESLVWQEGMSSWIPFGQMNQPPASVVSEPHCAECNRTFPPESLLAISGSFVCSGCKQSFVQRLQEGSHQPTGKMEYAGFLVRVGARMIDGIIMNICSGIAGAVIGMAVASSELDIEAFQLALHFVGLMIGLTYEVFFVTQFGATPGKMALKLRIVRPDGGPISFGRAIGRHFSYLLGIATLFIGYLMAAFDKEEHRALHDRICDTRVIRT